ncbi:lipopolysaccharide biosynthesis protein [Bacillota bacterium LCP21S3_A4]
MKTKGVLSSFIWRFAERCGAQGVSFVVSLVLARILAPEMYGTIALVNVIITIFNVFVDSGLGNALIQKKNADDVDFSSVFYFNVSVCVLLYIILYFMAPMIADFYDQQDLALIVRVLGITIIISGVKNIQQAYIFKTLQFKRFFFSTLGGTIGSAVAGIAMAYKGYGVWALVVQQIFNTAVDTMILWITVKWRPKALFSIVRLKGLASYGWKLLVSSLLEKTYNNLRQLIIGKIYTSSDLAFYNKGKQFPELVTSNINTSIDSVLFPVISANQDNIEHVKKMTRRSVQVSSFVIWPAMIGMATCADSIVRILLTDKWSFCVPFLQIFCLTYGFYPIHTANLNAIKAIGRSDIFLKLEIGKKIIGIVSIMASVHFGTLAMAGAFLITEPICALINATPNRKLIGYSYKELISDVLPPILLSLFMSVVIYVIGIISMQIYIKLLLQIFAGIFIYICGAAIFKFDSLSYLIKQIQTAFNL